MIPRVVVPLLTALCLLVTSCRDAPVPTVAFGRGAGSTDTLTASVVLSIGAVEGSEENTLSRVYSAFLHGDRIFVANGGEHEIREYSVGGDLVRRIGRRGRGPGEFTSLRWIAPLRNDSILALDGFTSRVTVFNEMGEFGRSFLLSIPGHGQAEWIVEYGSGFAAGYAIGIDPRGLQLGQPARDSSYVAILEPAALDAQAVVKQVLPPVGGRWWQREEAVNAFGLAAIEGGPYPLFSVRDTMLFAAANDGHSIQLWSGETWETIVLAGQNWTNGEIDREAGISAHLYYGLTISSDGTVWLGESDAESSTLSVWRQFDGNGQPLAVLLVPVGFRIWQVESDVILGKRTDKDGVEFVELLQIDVKN